MRIYVDMDDTICDFTTAKLEKWSEEMQYPQSQLDFFRKLKPIDDAIESLNRLNKIHDVWILTRPTYLNPLCYTEKRLWIEDHLGLDWCNKLIISPDKSLLIGDILIDDHPWPYFQGEQILFRYDFPNQGNGEWNRIVQYIESK